MVFDSEALGCKHRQIGRTRVDIKDSLALVALEMVMMPVVAQLKTWIFTGQHDLAQRPVLDHGFQVSIDRCDPEVWYVVRSKLEYLLGQQRASRGVQGFFDRSALSCGAFHSF